MDEGVADADADGSQRRYQFHRLPHSRHRRSRLALILSRGDYTSSGGGGCGGGGVVLLGNRPSKVGVLRWRRYISPFRPQIASVVGASIGLGTAVVVAAVAPKDAVAVV
jgi:hypothetical protein